MSNFYIVPTDARMGANVIALGLLRACDRVGHKVAFFKPISQNPDSEGVDASTHFAREIFKSETPAPLSMAEVEGQLAVGGKDEIVGRIVENFAKLPQGRDVTIIEGLEPRAGGIDVHSLNYEIARNLNARIIFIVDCDGFDAATVAARININLRSDSKGAFGYVLAKLSKGLNPETFAADVKSRLKGPAKDLVYLGAVPYVPAQFAPRMKDVKGFIGAEVVAGEDKLASSRVSEVVVGVESVETMQDRFKPGVLIISAGDRDDVVMGSAMAVKRGVALAGLVLTGGIKPSDKTKAFIEPMMKDLVPILLTKEDTFRTARLINDDPGEIPHDDPDRMKGMAEFVADRLDKDALRDKLKLPEILTMAPELFKHKMIERARAANKRIVLPEGDEPRTIKAAIECHRKGIARCVLLAKRAKVDEQVRALELELPGDIEILDPDEIKGNYVNALVEMRKSKGMTPEQASELLNDTVYIGTMMLALDEVDGLVSGAVHTTANTIRPALQLIKTDPGASLVSSVFFMLMPEQVYVYGDCAVNPKPTAQELADIAIQSYDSAVAFGIDPKVAMISYSTGSSGQGEDVDKVKEATALAKSKRPDIVIDGPLQYDAASVESVGRQKAPDSPVAGRATVFVFPDLNTGNCTYKAVQRSADVLSVGPMLQGLRKPVNDLSRGALVGDIVYTIALTAIQAVAKSKK